MNVVVPAPHGHAVPASQALTMEGVEHQVYPMESELAYGRLITHLWNEGQPFIIVEHDIIPWPGALRGLADCPEPWCLHAYPLHRGNIARSFGIGKYRPIGPAPHEWSRTPWHLLDGFVLPHVRQTVGPYCEHTPPVAHARREVA